MTDRFGILPLKQLLRLILNEYESKDSILGLDTHRVFKPLTDEPIQSTYLGHALETPIGVAAGPHTQLAQNIVMAWLCGARFIELKTIQVLDKLDVSKPCIDMQDEGYNCEWSQELTIHQSFDQYLNAWILIHILRDKLGMHVTTSPGFVFNMSVGYDLKGILSEKVQWFLDRMENASVALQEKLEEIRPLYPRIYQLKIPARLSDNVTLSTMHGCPPDEIEQIAAYLIEQRKLHTSVKLNPTLLGKDRVWAIMHRSGFDTRIPDIAFEHDPTFEDAVKIIGRLREKAAKNQRHFGIKLTNTLESVNHKEVFPANESMMYMSGRALHPISVNLAARLQESFGGELTISFSGGADAFNVSELLACGLAPVTVCSDLLKPGGFGRLNQYISELRSTDIPFNTTDQNAYLKAYAQKVLHDPGYRKNSIHDPDLKTDRPLSYFDCIHAPCEDTCPTHQDIPSYLHFAAMGDFASARTVIEQTNPFPHTTGMICDHLCQTRCVRIHYDHPVLIREIKRFIAERTENDHRHPKVLKREKAKRVAIIGAGPSGLACAWFLATNGMKVTVFESGAEPGGMIQAAIPAFRLTDQAIATDVARIRQAGVDIHYHSPIDKTRFDQLRNGYDFIYIAAGAHRSVPLKLVGIEAEGVLDPIEFLSAVKRDERPKIGKKVIIIGGGNTAMDAARTAWRLVGDKGKVTIVYRRTIRQMPADQGEIKAVLEEGVNLMELCNPVRIHSVNGLVKGVVCQKMELGPKDQSGRQSPIPVADSAFLLEADTLIPAIGQEKAFDFADHALLLTDKNSYETRIPGVFIGGDALRGASTAIHAIGDGRKAASQILSKAGLSPEETTAVHRLHEAPERLMERKSRREYGPAPTERDASERRDFGLITKTLNEKEVIQEAARCLKCDELCSLCTTVCPNLAFHAFRTTPQAVFPGTIVRTHAGYEMQPGARFEIRQETQILHLADWCNECGNCTTFCPSAGSPYRDKAHLYFIREHFEAEKDGYFLDQEKGYPNLEGYIDGEKHRLSIFPEYALFESERFRVKLEESSFQVSQVEFRDDKTQRIDLVKAALFRTMLEGANSFFHLY